MHGKEKINMRLENRSVVVTGASSGMGKAIVELFVKEGANVIAVARRKERLDALAASLSEEAGRIIVMKGDISLREDNEAMIDLALSSFGRLDVLVNNAGIMDDMSPIGDVEDERYERVMKTNVYGPMCAMRKAVDVFTKQESGGTIINIASVGGMRSVAGAVSVSPPKEKAGAAGASATGATGAGGGVRLGAGEGDGAGREVIISSVAGLPDGRPALPGSSEVDTEGASVATGAGSGLRPSFSLSMISAMPSTQTATIRPMMILFIAENS